MGFTPCLFAKPKAGIGEVEILNNEAVFQQPRHFATVSARPTGETLACFEDIPEQDITG
jgi:hypothetical protein